MVGLGKKYEKGENHYFLITLNSHCGVGLTHKHLVLSIFPDRVSVSMPHPKRRWKFLVFTGGGMGESAHRRGQRGQGSRGKTDTLSPLAFSWLLEKKNPDFS